MLDTLVNPELWGQYGGLFGLAMLFLFVLLFVEMVMLRRSHDRMLDAILTRLYKEGHLPDRRGRKPVGE